jgi:tetratricopeptide (TPR) repeat protein
VSFGEGGEKVRAVVPRWRSLTNTPSVETIPTPNFPDIDPTTTAEFKGLLAIWRRNDRAIDAVDILDAGIATGSRKLIVEGANRVLRNADELRPEVIERAKEFLAGKPRFVRVDSLVATESTQAELFDKIRRLKVSINEASRSSLPRVEIARLYTRLGQLDEAERHLRVALALSPNDRFTLRAVTRFYTMVGLPDEALISLWDAPALGSDPWLMSAELAAATLARRSTKKAQRLARRLDLQKEISRQLSELATGWITKETLRGRHDKRTLKTLERTLADPTENALAQGIWLTDRLGRDFTKTFPSIQLPREAHEARALSFVEESKFRNAEIEAGLWVADQPFQLRSFWLLIFIRFVHLRDYAGVLRVVDEGLFVHPNDWMLINYGVLGSCLSGELARADEFLDRFERTPRDEEGETYLLAAKGLRHFTRNDFEAGIDCYMSCLRKSRAIRRPDLAVNSTIFLLESLCRHSAISVADVRFLEARIKRAIRHLSATEQRDISQIFRSRKQVWDELLEETDGLRMIDTRFDARLLEQELPTED